MKRILPAIVSTVLTFQAMAQQPLAQGKEKWLGSIHSSSQIQDFEKYWNQVTPENAGKWGSVEGTRDVYNWTQLDAAYNFAKENGFPFRYHVLLWGNQQPSWIESLEPDEQLEEIEEWMDTVAARYPDIDYLEVINEPIHDAPFGAGNGDYYLALGGSGTTGFDWILTGFRMAKERFPETKLVLNDYNILSSTTNANRYITFINALKAEGLIDVIGVQGHAFTTTASNEVMKGVLDDLAETGLPVMVTELDIDGPSDQKQLEDYQRIFPLLWEHPSVIGITLWGFRPGLWRNEQKAYLIDTDGSERPALTWLREYVEETFVSLTLDEKLKQELSIYPNPAQSHFTIRSEEAIKQVKIYDLVGKTVHESSSQQVELPGHIPAGTYVVAITTISGRQISQRLKIN